MKATNISVLRNYFLHLQLDIIPFFIQVILVHYTWMECGGGGLGTQLTAAVNRLSAAGD